jgi:hypothetical protein
MIQKYVDAWFRNKHKAEEKLRKKIPGSYCDIVKMVVEVLEDNQYGDYESILSPENIVQLGGEDYQGDYLYIIQEKSGWSGSLRDSWCAVIVSYGSCSGCDTLEYIHSLNGYPYNNEPSEEQVKQCMTLCLHVVQGLKKIEE